MVYRFSWIAGIAAIGLAFWELSSLMRESVVGTPWQVAIIAATLLGAGITWTTIAYRAPAWVIAITNVAAFIIFAGLITAPETLFLMFPTGETWAVISGELQHASEIIQHNVEPVRPVPGLVLLIALLFWTLGFLLTAGLLNDRPFVAILTPLIVAVQFAIIDRKPKSLAHLAMFILIVAFSLIAIRADERDRGTGRLQRVNASKPPSRRPTPAIGVLITTTVVAGLVAVSLIGTAVPSDGFVSWRQPSGYSDSYSGSASYNPFIDIRAGLNLQTDNPLFTADITGTDPSTVRFRTVTLDTYRNGRWFSSEHFQAFPLDEEVWVDPQHAYRGETTEIVADITIQNLSQPFLPAPSTPSAAQAASDGDTKTMRVRRLDGSLYFAGDVSYDGMEYSVRSDIPTLTRPQLGQLMRTPTGELSPLFQAAAEAGEDMIALNGSVDIIELENLDRWIETPEDLGSGVSLTARNQTRNMTTNFEKALALEHFLRLSGQFVYDSEVPAEFTTSDVSDWLTDPNNPYARHGYCEQFAYAMAVMGRTIGVPSRVVLGFTAGEALNDSLVQVRDRNAHAWVEMWIPSYGWMAFDPTPRSGYAATTANENLTATLGFSPAQYADTIPTPQIVDDTGGDIGPDAGRFEAREEQSLGFVPGAGGTDGGGLGISIPAWAEGLIAIVTVAIVAVLLIPVTKWWRRRRRLARLKHGDIASAWADITDRLADLGESVNPAATPLETAESIDPAFVPLAETYGRSVYGEYESTTTVIETATVAHTQAVQHMATRFSPLERTLAAFRPTRLLRRWTAIVGRRNGNGD